MQTHGRQVELIIFSLGLKHNHMKKTLLLLIGFSASVVAEPKYYPITRVLDGDTVAFEAKFLPSELKPELKLRIWGVDTPEKGKRAQCPAEARLGEQATGFTKDAVVSSKKQEIDIKDWDKFGGRVLGDLYLDGVSLRTMLIQQHFAREYYGDKKQSWCK